MARVVRLAVAVVVAVALIVALLLVLQGRDRSTFEAAGPAPGTLEPDQGCAHRPPPPGFRFATRPPTSGPHRPVAVTRGEADFTRDQLLHALELGNVVLVYGDRADRPALRDLAMFSPGLLASGQAVLLDRRPGTTGVVALAWRRLLRVGGPDDPRLQAFVDAWLGHGCAKMGA